VIQTLKRHFVCFFIWYIFWTLLP